MTAHTEVVTAEESHCVERRPLWRRILLLPAEHWLVTTRMVATAIVYPGPSGDTSVSLELRRMECGHLMPCVRMPLGGYAVISGVQCTQRRKRVR